MNDDQAQLFRHLFDTIARPLISGAEEDYGRLIRFVELNDEETNQSLFGEILAVRGGREVLENLFFTMARDQKPGLRVLGRVLTSDTTASFGDRFQSEIRLGEKSPCLGLISALPEFMSHSWGRSVLAATLLDRDSDIRDGASQTLFALMGEDCGYDPTDPPAEREAMVQEILGAAGRS